MSQQPVATVIIAGRNLCLIEATSGRDLTCITYKDLVRRNLTGRQACQEWCDANGYVLETTNLK